MTETRWNGEPCKARRITAIVADDGRFPAYWARHLAGTRRQIVEVEYGGETFYLDDEDSSGWHKVTHGGSPRWTHSNITIDPGSIQPRTQQLMADWHAAGCARDCSEQHTYRLGRCVLSTETAPEPTISITRVQTEADGKPGIVVRSIPVSAWEALVKVAMWVSRGRSAAFIPDADIAPAYPDAAARRALGALHDAGLLPLCDEPSAVSCQDCIRGAHGQNYHRRHLPDPSHIAKLSDTATSDEGEDCCGAEPPADGSWGDCWCTLPPGHTGEHRCQPCSDRHGAPGWQDEPAAPPRPDDVDEHVCKPGARLYYCPAGDEVESDCHGGFDVCCDRPDLHQPLLKCNRAHLRQPHDAHSWEPQPGMNPVHCEGYGEPATERR
ncbi:hypothetical protein ACIQCF_07400 [Streptomyces sp. NPDC088353]|uniref:hypothetical protein n=1 Tax=Streptomyces sp. NPDC088353 TaxID=3365855 RepID=UPI00380754F8